MIISRTPFRISFFGGGSDYPAWYQQYGGKVFGTTIDKYCYISLRHLPAFFDYKHRIVYSKIEQVSEIEEIRHPAVRAVFKTMNVTDGLEVHHDGDLPARSGLGSSSSFTVGLIHALKAIRGEMIQKRDLANEAVYMEQEVLKENVGSQDQILTSVGGMNTIEFFKDGTFDVTPVILNKEKIDLLQKHMVLCFTGFTRIASEIAKTYMGSLEKRKVEIMAMQDMVGRAMDVFQKSGNLIEDFGSLLNEYWALKKNLSDNVSNPEIDQIYEAAMKAGAAGGKLLGAGGGGFLLLMIKPGMHQKVYESLKGLTFTSFRFDYTGSKIVVYEPNNFQ